MNVEVTEKFRFESAHRIDGIGKENSCIHGHSHKVFVTISGKIDPEKGWLIERGDFRKRVKGVVKYLDHSYLNEFMDQTTAEALARHIFLRLQEDRFPRNIKLVSVKVCKVGMSAKISND